MKQGRRIRKRLSTNLDAAKDMLNELRSRADRGELNCSITVIRGPT